MRRNTTVTRHRYAVVVARLLRIDEVNDEGSVLNLEETTQQKMRRDNRSALVASRLWSESHQ